MLKVNCDEQGIEKALEIFNQGGIVVFPTDTVYGIGCDPYNKEAIQKISEQALDHMQTGRFEDAGNSLTKVIELMDAEHADLPEVYYERGTMFIGTEDFRSAIADFQSAARIYRSRGEQADAEYMEELAEIYTSY